MCGRYDIGNAEHMVEMRAILDEVNQRYTNTAEQLKARTEIAPTNVAPIMVKDGTILAKWGIPKKDNGIHRHARAESISERPTYAKAFEERRCIIPATGFYEWTHTPVGKPVDKYFFQFPGEKMMYMAGIYGTYEDAKGDPYTAFVICTTKSSESVKDVHDRMPVMLTEDQRLPWLNSFGAALEILSSPHNDAFIVKLVKLGKGPAKKPEQLSFI